MSAAKPVPGAMPPQTQWRGLSDPLRLAYLEGAQARRECLASGGGLPDTDPPYPVDSLRGRFWSDGWVQEHNRIVIARDLGEGDGCAWVDDDGAIDTGSEIASFISPPFRWWEIVVLVGLWTLFCGLLGLGYGLVERCAS